MNIKVEGEEFILSPKRALLWPRKKLLAIADLHFGKSTTFQSHGYWLPEKAELNDLETLRDLITNHSIEIVVFLGDFLHHSLEFPPRVATEIRNLNETFQDTRFILVVGNHDQRMVNEWPDIYKFIELRDSLVVEQFRFTHDVDPQKKFNEALYTWYGHVHPVVRLNSGPDKLRLPVFWLEEHQGCLPAFSSLAGGFDVKQDKSNRLFAVTSEKVIPLFREIKKENPKD